MALPLALIAVAAVVLGLALMRLLRHDRAQQRQLLAERSALAGAGGDGAPAQVPIIDLARCLGCGTCVKACPEEGVLALVHGQAAVVNGALCVGHARCVAECPVSAVTLGRPDDAPARADVPMLSPDLEAEGTPGVFLAGEITTRALIRTAVDHGAAAARTIAARARSVAETPGVLDAVVVGAGPGGLAAALGCQEAGLAFAWIDQEHTIGGTVARYPRRKLVLTEPLTLPLHGLLRAREYPKEELIELWQALALRHDLPFTGGVRLAGLARDDDGAFTVQTSTGELRTHNVVLALGRRGVPRQLGVPGEDLPHVANGLLDASSYQGRAVAVVGGGDSAVEAALALSEQDGNAVTLIHRRDSFFRVRKKNRDRLAAAQGAGALQVLTMTEVRAIHADRCLVQRTDRPDAPLASVAADFVFVMLGGTAPLELLASCGVRCGDGAAAATAAVPERRWPFFAAAVTMALAVAAFALWHSAYYGAAIAERAADPAHALLRPDQELGLWFGIAAIAAVLANLAYLLRRRRTRGFHFGSLTAWMDLHVLTGAGAVALAALHAGFRPRATPGGHAMWLLFALFATGAIGRWFYAWLPRAANGRELELDAVRADLRRAFAAAGDAAAAHEVEAMLERRRWHASLPGRMLTLLGLQWDLMRTLRRLHAAGASQETLADVRAAHRLAVAAAHLEDLRQLLASWRWLHRWGALLLLLLVLVHVVMAWAHGAFAGGQL